MGHARLGIQHLLRLIAAVERNSLAGLVASLTGGKLRYAVAELQWPWACRECRNHAFGAGSRPRFF